jgi:hypothetical protein
MTWIPAGVGDTTSVLTVSVTAGCRIRKVEFNAVASQMLALSVRTRSGSSQDLTRSRTGCRIVTAAPPPASRCQARSAAEATASAMDMTKCVLPTFLLVATVRAKAYARRSRA